MKRMLIILCCCVLPLGGALSETANPKRLAAATDWYDALPVEELVEDSLRYIAGFYPTAIREKFFKIAYRSIDYALIKKTMITESAKVFTIAELQTLARFYRTPEGRPIAAKLGRYLMAVVPALQAQLFHATQEAMEKIE